MRENTEQLEIRYCTTCGHYTRRFGAVVCEHKSQDDADRAARKMAPREHVLAMESIVIPTGSLELQRGLEPVADARGLFGVRVAAAWPSEWVIDVAMARFIPATKLEDHIANREMIIADRCLQQRRQSRRAGILMTMLIIMGGAVLALAKLLG